MPSNKVASPSVHIHSFFRFFLFFFLSLFAFHFLHSFVFSPSLSSSFLLPLPLLLLLSSPPDHPYHPYFVTPSTPSYNCHSVHGRSQQQLQPQHLFLRCATSTCIPPTTNARCHHLLHRINSHQQQQCSSFKFNHHRQCIQQHPQPNH